MRNLMALIAGGLFGAGLLVSGSTDTRVIFGWLDLLGGWNPTLGFMFIGSAVVMALAWQVARRRNASALGSPMPAKLSAKSDPALVAGSLMFGAGWGLTGICPGPSIASLSFGGTSGAIFMLSMITGMLIAVPVKSGLGRRALNGAVAESV